MGPQELYTTPFYSDSNLKAYWRFLSGDLTDSIGSVVQGSGSGSTSISGGKFGYGRDYDGASGNSETHIPYSATFAPGNRKTIAFWIKIMSTPGGLKIILDDCNTNSGATNFIRWGLSAGLVVSLP